MNTTDRPLVSIYIPTKDRCELLKRAVDSVLNQSYKKIEIIIVDDNSSDGTYEYLQELSKSDTRVIYFRNETKKGACYSRNIAISHARGFFCTGLDDDDIFSFDRIEFLVNNWDERYSFITTKSANYRNKPGVKKYISRFLLFCERNKEYKNQDLYEYNYVGNQVFTKTEYLKEDKFDEDLPALQDYDLWFRLSKKHGDFIVYKQRTQLIDTLHGLNRITNYNRRLIAITHMEKKFGIESEFKYIKLVWKLEFREKISLSEYLVLVKHFKILMLLFILLKR